MSDQNEEVSKSPNLDFDVNVQTCLLQGEDQVKATSVDEVEDQPVSLED